MWLALPLSSVVREVGIDSHVLPSLSGPFHLPRPLQDFPTGFVPTPPFLSRWNGAREGDDLPSENPSFHPMVLLLEISPPQKVGPMDRLGDLPIPTNPALDFGIGFAAPELPRLEFSLESFACAPVLSGLFIFFF